MSNQVTATAAAVLENPSQLQLLIDQLQVAPGAENDDETVLQKYWRDVYGIAALLDPAAHQHDISDMSITGKNRHRWMDGSTKVCYLMSITNSDRRTTAGTVCKAPPRIAAECLVKHTHRLATDEQIAGHEKEHKRRFDEAQALRNSEKTAAEQIAGALTTALSNRSKDRSPNLPS
jgi:hypothetical protein